MTEFEKKYLKEAICNMIDEDRTYGYIDTMELRENAERGGLSYYDFILKEWKFSIMVTRSNEYGIQ